MQAYKTITVDIEGVGTISLPFTLQLMRDVEQTIQEATAASWFPIGKAKRMTDVFIKFATPHFPKGFDWSKADPTLSAFFFMSVRNEFHRSIEEWTNAMASIPGSEDPTENRKS